MKVDLGGRPRTANDLAADALRRRFARSGTFVANLISAPGSGKTALLEATARALEGELAMGAIVGDVETDLDARRLSAAGLRARQIDTHGACHLDARMIERVIEDVPPEGLDLLFIENVGNLVCPVAFDVGEDAKVALVSLAEGPDKPAKYPTAFARSGAFVVTKTDLAGVLDCDVGRMVADARAVNPAIAVFELSSKTGEGLPAWLDWLRARVGEKKAAGAGVAPKDAR